MSNYVEKTYEEIFESMLNDSLENGLISHAEDFQDFIANRQDISNYYVMDKSVIAQMFSTFYEDMTRVYESAKVEYAEGTDLDDIGKIVGIERPEATSAEVDVTFTLDGTASEDITIPSGVIVSTDTGIEYTTLDSIYIAENDNTDTVRCRCNTPGVAGKIASETIVNVDSDLTYDFTVINESDSSGGSEAYNDDEYRYLLLNWVKIRLKGSNEAYEYYFANLDGIDSYRLVPNWDGEGTMKVVVDPGTESQLNSIYDDLQNKVSQNTEDITMFAPNYKYIDIYAIVNVDIDQINPYSNVEKEKIQSRIISAIKCFIDGGSLASGDYYQGLILGEDFIPHKLAVFLDNEIPELKNISFSYPTDYVPILDDELGVSHTLTVEMV